MFNKTFIYIALIILTKFKIRQNIRYIQLYTKKKNIDWRQELPEAERQSGGGHVEMVSDSGQVVTDFARRDVAVAQQVPQARKDVPHVAVQDARG